MRIDGRQYGGVCACGKEHTMATKLCVIEAGALGRLEELLLETGLGGKRCAVYGSNTFANPYFLHPRAEQEIVLPSEGLHADERSTAAVLEQLDADVELLLACGSGSIHDTVRYCAAQRGIPFVALPTAASVDGFCSAVAAMTWKGYKKTINAVAPVLVAADIDVIRRAPAYLTASGVGDVLGKFIALADWRIAHELTGESVCPVIYGIMEEAVGKIWDSCLDTLSGSEEAFESVMYGLLMSGLAMQLMGNSRPASGAEHHMSHYWEVVNEQRGTTPAMHGEQVAVGTVLVLMLAEELLRLGTPDFDAGRRAARSFDAAAWEREIRRAYGSAAGEVLELEAKAQKNAVGGRLGRIDAMEARWEEIRAQLASLRSAASVRELLREIGCPCTPEEIGLDESDLRDTFLYCKEVRARYTLLSLVSDLGLMETLADQVIDRATGQN